MLKISRLADYALLILRELTRQAPAYSSANLVAASTHLALPTVSKILKKLAEVNILVSVRGANGGYRLALAAEEISLAAVISAIDGHFALTECCKPGSNCEQQATCDLTSHWQVINQIIYNVLKSLSLADLKNPLIPSQIKISLNPQAKIFVKGSDHA